MKITKDWMDDISLAMQGVLMCAMRGPDATVKESTGKSLTRALRAVCLNGAHFKGHDDFMGDHSGWIESPQWMIETNEFERERLIDKFVDDHDAYPHHWLMHLIHAAEIVGYLHPDHALRDHWLGFYQRMVSEMHMLPEPKDAMEYRLRERNPPCRSESVA